MSSNETFNDHFSEKPQDYLRHRPTYPAALFEHLAEITPSTGRALDCATGNGQAAVDLAAHFDEVIATDASAAQLEHAMPHPKMRYERRLAEATGLPDASVDLATAAAAAHWFDIDRFCVEMKRILRPGGVLALWTYDGSPQVTPEVEAEVEHLREAIAGTDWPPGFENVRTGYRNLAFPFEELEAPKWQARADWDLAGLLGHLRSWSAVRRFAKREGCDPVASVEDGIRAAWGDPETVRPVTWPLHARIGRHHPPRP